jgi:hypothetical protein
MGQSSPLLMSDTSSFARSTLARVRRPSASPDDQLTHHTSFFMTRFIATELVGARRRRRGKGFGSRLPGVHRQLDVLLVEHPGVLDSTDVLHGQIDRLSGRSVDDIGIVLEFGRG